MNQARPVYIVDPFGTTREYDESLLRHIQGALPGTRLLTTTFNDRRNAANAAGEGAFLRTTATFARRFPAIPLRGLKAMGAIEYVVDLIRLARRAKRDQALVHWQWLPFPIIAVPILIAGGLRKQSILTAHDVLQHHARNRDRLPVAEAWKYTFPRRIVVHSPNIERTLVALAPATKQKISVIPHGLSFEGLPARDRKEARTRLNLPVDATIFGFVGLIRPHKGLGDLIEAWKMLGWGDDREHDAHLVIAGEWRNNEWTKDAFEEGKRIQAIAAAHHDVTLRTGYMSESDFVDFLSAIDLLVLPYRTASQSGVALAALRYGIPMIVTSVGALPELMHGELQQWIVPPERPDLLAEKLASFLRLNHEARAALADAVRTQGEMYRWESIAPQYVDLYRDIQTGERD